MDTAVENQLALFFFSFLFETDYGGVFFSPSSNVIQCPMCVLQGRVSGRTREEQETEIRRLKISRQQA